MRLKALILAAVCMALQGCNLPSGPGGGTGGDGLTGIIVDAQGAPVKGARVWLYPDSSAGLNKRGMAAVFLGDSVLTPKSGRFSFSHLPVGRYTLSASFSRHDTAFSIYRPGILLAGIGTLDLGIDTLARSATLSLSVGDADARPVAGALCVVEGTSWRATSDTSGKCVFINIAAGELRVRVTASGKNATTSPVILNPGETGATGQVYLYRAGESAPQRDWYTASAQDYVFSLPPEMEVQYEGTAIDSWDASYKMETSDLKITALYLVSRLSRPVSVPGYYEDTVPLIPSVRAIYVAYKDSTGIYRVGVEIEDQRGASASYIVFNGKGATVADSARLATVLRSVKSWAGPGAIPVAPPPRAVLVSPDSNANKESLFPVFAWRAPFGWNATSTLLTGYQLQVATDTLFSNLKMNISVPVSSGKPDGGALRFSATMPDSLARGARYYWRVIAVGAGGTSVSRIREFRTIPPAPYTPQLVSPAINDTGVSRTPVVSWGVLLDAPTGADYIQVQISPDSLFSTLAINDSAVPFYHSQYSWRVSGLLDASSRYYVRLIAVGRGGSTISSVRAFTTGTQAYAAPVVPALMGPAPNGSVSQSSSTFSWISNPTNTSSYYLQVASDSLFQFLSVYDAVELGNAQTGVQSWTLRYSVLNKGGTYYWRVIGVGPGGFTPSEPRKVTVD